jgi:hypothetical protein
MPMAPGLAVKTEIVTQQKGLDADAGAPNIDACGVAGTHQVADCLVQCVRDPDIGEFAGTEQSR